MEKEKVVILSDKSKIILDDENDIFISLIVDGKTENTFSVPYPSAGYGGGSLFISSSKQYLLFSYFSGQCQEAFILFKINNYYLELLYESKYLYGEDANYCFLNDEQLLLQTLRTGWWYSEMDKPDKYGDNFYEFGQINILNINTKVLDIHTIHVYPSDDWEEEITDIGPFLFSSMINNSLNIMMPWGQESFQLPLKDILTIR